MSWYYKNKIFTSEDIGPNVAFVYEITDKTTGLKYLGKKAFWSTITKAPLKGTKRKRKITTESDWPSYYGSGGFKQLGIDEPHRFHREILYLCESRQMAAYLETKSQFDRNVLFDPTYINGIIACRINKSHVKKHANSIISCFS